MTRRSLSRQARAAAGLVLAAALVTVAASAGSAATGTASPDRAAAAQGGAPRDAPGAAPRDDLDAWPQDYQDFVAEVGGSRFVEVDGIRMHYVDTEPDAPRHRPTILLVHGIPTHTYLWRDVVPELRENARVVAVDLVGYGRSDRPRLGEFGYTPAEHARVFGGFVDALDLRRVNLVLHDLGGPVGLGWASDHPRQVASLTLVETLWSTVPSIEQVPEPFGPLLDQLRTPGVGEALVRDQNAFVAGLGDLTVTGLSEEEQAVYAFVWQDPDERLVQLPSGPLGFPVVDESPVATAFVADYVEVLQRSRVRKLVVDTTPGLLSQVQVEGPTGDLVRQPELAALTFPRTTVAGIDGAGHYLQEDRPEELGRVIDDFVHRR